MVLWLNILISRSVDSFIDGLKVILLFSRLSMPINLSIQQLFPNEVKSTSLLIQALTGNKKIKQLVACFRLNKPIKLTKKV